MLYIKNREIIAEFNLYFAHKHKNESYLYLLEKEDDLLIKKLMKKLIFSQIQKN